MNEPGVTQESEFVLRRLNDAFPYAPPEASDRSTQGLKS